MAIGNDVRAEIRWNMSDDKIEKALKQLLKLKMSAENIDNISDEIFLNNNIAWCYLKMKNIEMQIYYLNLNSLIFEDEIVKNERLPAYYAWLWMYTIANKQKISEELFCFNFLEIHKYYKAMGSERYSIGAIEEIVIRKGNDERIIKFLKGIVQKMGLTQLVRDILKDCDNISVKVSDEIKKILDSQKENVI